MSVTFEFVQYTGNRWCNCAILQSLAEFNSTVHATTKLEKISFVLLAALSFYASLKILSSKVRNLQLILKIFFSIFHMLWVLGLYNSKFKLKHCTNIAIFRELIRKKTGWQLFVFDIFKNCVIKVNRVIKITTKNHLSTN